MPWPSSFSGGGGPPMSSSGMTRYRLLLPSSPMPMRTSLPRLVAGISSDVRSITSFFPSAGAGMSSFPVTSSAGVLSGSGAEGACFVSTPLGGLV